MKIEKPINDHWFKLDNAGKLYPSIASSRVSTIFRMTAVLKMPIRPILLQKSLEVASKRYPIFNVRLRKGVFWYYFERNPLPPILEKELSYPCTSLNLKSNHPVPFKVLYHHNRVHLEISHAITDGAGALIFLKDILAHYHQLLQDESPVELPPVENLKECTEDAFQKYYEKGIPGPNKVGRAYHFPFKLIESGAYDITSGIFNATKLKNLAKNYKTSPTKMLLCLYFETILEYMRTQKSPKRPIVINMPVNLRGVFPSNTMRNFFVSITPSIDPRLGSYSREEIIELLNGYFYLNLNKKNLKKYISRNFKNELFWHVRLIPLFIKNALIPFIYSYYGESSYTTSLSNLGVIDIKEPFGEMIERFEVLPPPSEGNIIKVTVITYNDITTLSFGSLTHDKVIEKLFFRKLKREGIEVKVESNRQKGEINGLL